MTKTKLLITGAASFIASNFVRRVLYDHKKYEIIGLDKISSSLALHSVFVNKNHKFYIADITDEHIINRIFEYEKPDVIIHFAALTSVDEGIKSPKQFIHNNVLGTQTIVEAAIKWKVKKIIFLSTDEVMGSLNDNDPSWTETDPTNPRNLYASTKLAGENIVASYGHSHGLKYSIIRSSNNYGPRQTVNKLIPRAIKLLLEDRKIGLYGDGSHIRDWLYVGDCCSGIIKVLEEGQNEEIYNVSANQEFSNLEVAQLICECLDLPLRIEFIEDRPGHDYRYSLDSSKLKSLGWQPNVKFRDGIKDTVEWYKNNRYWFK